MNRSKGRPDNALATKVDHTIKALMVLKRKARAGVGFAEIVELTLKVDGQIHQLSLFTGGFMFVCKETNSFIYERLNKKTNWSETLVAFFPKGETFTRADCERLVTHWNYMSRVNNAYGENGKFHYTFIGINYGNKAR